MKLFNWLTENQYKNAHNYAYEKFPSNPSVVCIDKKASVFFGVNVTCLACAVSSGQKIIDIKEFIN